MPRFDSDYALIGTGVAPLVAAAHLVAHGKSALVLNPDFDFFLENSELSLDPLLPPADVGPARINAASPEAALSELRAEFPGAIELWGGGGGRAAGERDFHDRSAPHVRQQARLWLSMEGGLGGTGAGAWSWDALEALYVEAEDAGLKPQILEGLAAARRIPGFAGSRSDARALYLPRVADVDVNRYRVGLLEFVREKLGSDRVVAQAAQMELIPEGLRFHAGGAPQSARIREGVLVFWTPRLSSWVLAQARRAQVHPQPPRGLRLWEQWSVASREPLDCGVVGSLGDLVVWTEVEGSPDDDRLRDRLAVLRAGPLAPIGSADPSSSAWVSGEAFQALSRLCAGLLQWERFSIRSMRPRAVFEWSPSVRPWPLTSAAAGSGLQVLVVPACDGPLVDVLRSARGACSGFLAAAAATAGESA